MDRDHFIDIREKRGFSQKEFAAILGVDPSYLSLIETGKRSISDSIRYKIEKMEEHFAREPDLPSSKTNVNDKRHKKLIPFFDVDIMATPIDVFNDQTTMPAYRIDMPGFSDCDFAINVFGHSMYPTIESGMIVLCKHLADKSLIAFGEIYFIVTSDFRMVKRLIKSTKKGFVTACSDNHNGHSSPDGKTYAPIDIPMDKILHIYIIKGSFKRHLI